MTRFDPLTPGRDLGKYRVVRRLATGGMAEIYLAQARGIEGFAKQVVLKRILPQYAQSETFVRLFLNEARLTASLDHPNIASVYDIGAADGIYFFAMEYLHGEDLGRILRELVARGEGLPLEHGLTIGSGVAAGLHAAHEKKGTDGKPLGIVHRDVSPSNVVLTYDGGVKLVDFGVAKATASAELTRTGTLKGKVSYMSPEQCNNDPIDRRSDIFALGVLLYELTTVTRLFKADSEAAALRLVLDAVVPPPSTRVPNYPPELEAVIMKMLARDRADRYATARDVQLALEEVARARGLVTSTASLGEWITTFFASAPTRSVLLIDGATGTDAEDSEADLTAKRLERGPELEPLTASDQERPAVTSAERRRRLLPRRRWPALAAGVATVLVAAAMVLLRPVPVAAPEGTPAASPRPGELPAPATAAPAGAGGGAAGGGPAVPGAPARAEPAAAVAPAPKRSAGRRASPSRAVLDEVRPQQFSAAFARKEGELLRCFARFGDTSAPSPQMAVRFHARTNGRVAAAEIIPPELASTPLGACVEKVATATEFGPQPTPVTFRIPVTLRRLGGARRP